MAATIRVTCWNEFRHEKSNDKVREVYPDGIHAAIARHLDAAGGIATHLAALDDPDCGLSEDVLAKTDVLIWWGHAAHKEVPDEVVDRVQQRVLEGMGLIALHSSHFSKPFKRLMGTACQLKWREVGEREVLWPVAPGHPILDGVGECIIVPQTEMYGEHFDIPAPDELLLISSFAGGEVFRSGCLWRRGAGKVFYFRPGHETYPIYHDETILRVITNAVRHLAPTGSMKIECPRKPMGWFEQDIA